MDNLTSECRQLEASVKKLEGQVTSAGDDVLQQFQHFIKVSAIHLQGREGRLPQCVSAGSSSSSSPPPPPPPSSYYYSPPPPPPPPPPLPPPPSSSSFCCTQFPDGAVIVCQRLSGGDMATAACDVPRRPLSSE